MNKADAQRPHNQLESQRGNMIFSFAEKLRRGGGGQNVEARAAVGGDAYRHIGQNEGRARRDKRPSIGEELLIHTDLAHEVFDIWRVAADTRRGEPTATTLQINVG